MKIVHTHAFSLDTLNTEWTVINAVTTPEGTFRIELTWELDRYRLEVKRVGREWPYRRVHAMTAERAVIVGNLLVREFAKREQA